MDKIFLGISWRGNPLLGLTVAWQNGEVVAHVVLFGIELFGLQFKRSKEEGK